jgi:hypothetical protein
MAQARTTSLKAVIAPVANRSLPAISAVGRRAFAAKTRFIAQTDDDHAVDAFVFGRLHVALPPRDFQRFPLTGGTFGYGIPRAGACVTRSGVVPRCKHCEHAIDPARKNQGWIVSPAALQRAIERRGVESQVVADLISPLRKTRSQMDCVPRTATGKHLRLTNYYTLGLGQKHSLS